jgi:polygalacturonase
MTLTKATYSMIDGAPANVLDFGADPTGVADSTAAFLAAMTAASNIYVPEGTYCVDAGNSSGCLNHQRNWL